MVARGYGPVMREDLVAGIAEIIAAIEPFDQLEGAHQEDALRWIGSGAPIFRIQKPDIPPKHLVSYFALIDNSNGKILLVDHKLAGLWLPSGGHVEPGEDPSETVFRAAMEELGVAAEFAVPGPVFVTVTETMGEVRHTDVSLWYVLRGDSTRELDFDPAEFHRVRWFHFDEIPFERSDPHLQRFIAKLKKIPECQTGS